jgi:hypothetical protein
VILPSLVFPGVVHQISAFSLYPRLDLSWHSI